MKKNKIIFIPFIFLNMLFSTACSKMNVHDPLIVDKDSLANKFVGPLYWSPYEYNFITDGYIPEDEWEKNINWLDKNLKSFGYKMVCIDGWGDDFKYNNHGYRTTHSSLWKHDYAWWSQNLKARGMELGIYNNPLWVIKLAADEGLKIKGTDIALSSIMKEDENATWFKWVQVEKPGAEEYVKGYIQFYADMGVRYLRVDFLSWFEDGQDRNMGTVGPKRPQEYYEKALKWMREACDKNGIFLSLVMPHLYNDAAIELKYGHMIRVNDDVGHGKWWSWSDNARGVKRVGWSQYANGMDGLTYWSSISGKGKMILDADFLRINTFSNDHEKKSVISACFISGGAVTIGDRYNSIGENIWLYQNKELLALREDGFVGKPLSNDPNNEKSQIWRGQLSNGDWIVALFNRENTYKSRGIKFSDLSENKMHVRDIWKHEDQGVMSSYFENIPPHGVTVLRLSK